MTKIDVGNSAYTFAVIGSDAGPPVYGPNGFGY